MSTCSTKRRRPSRIGKTRREPSKNQQRTSAIEGTTPHAPPAHACSVRVLDPMNTPTPKASIPSTDSAAYTNCSEHRGGTVTIIIGARLCKTIGHVETKAGMANKSDMKYPPHNKAFTSSCSV